MNAKSKKRAEGFTLIEAIVVLVVTAIVGTIFVTFFGTSILKSHVPRENLVKAKDLNQVMANIRADYKPYPVWKPNHVYSAANGDKVIPTSFSLSGQRYWYLCTTQGTSGLTEPDPWTTGVISDGANVKWTYQGDLMKLNQLKTYIGAEDTVNKKCATPAIPTEKCYDKSTKLYGYYVIENKWIDFDPATKIETASTNQNTLKVTIKNDAGETLTSLFF
jgi:type II secretory pathway pseudopilin PulG